MAKIVDTHATDQQASASPMPESPPLMNPEFLKFRDKVYTSRLLVVPATGRTLLVSKGVVEVPASDIEGVRFLKANDEFEPLKE